MSLKEDSREIFTRYGLNDREIKILLAYLGLPQTTSGMISEYLQIDYEEVKIVTDKLVESGFLKEIKTAVGINRYIPLEPYFSLYIKESSVFREEIEKIKDSVLEDQSSRFKQLEEIKNNSISEIDSAVDKQIEDFFKVSDGHDVDKNSVIEKARERFSSTSKTLESQIHEIIERDFSEMDSDVNQMDANTGDVLDQSSSKLEQLSNTHSSKTKQLESNFHQMIDTLNSQLKGISDGFIIKYETGVKDAKLGINNIVSDLLKDFAIRVNKLEVEMKKDLDSHVDHHKENAQALIPKLEEILAKYMSRMHDVVEELKRNITKLLYEHIDHILSTTEKMQTDLKDKINDRQGELIGQVKSFEDNTTTLIDNLVDISGNLGDLSKNLSKRGSAFKALFAGKHKSWVALNKDVQERVGKFSSTTKEDFVGSTSKYIENTISTRDSLKKEITDIVSEENNTLKIQTDDLDKKAQSTVNAELEGLAKELSGEIDATIRENIEHCKETTIKLKDLTESNLSTHKEDYDSAINRHLKTSVDHYEDSDKNVKSEVNGWYIEMDQNHTKIKSDSSTIVDQHIGEVQDHYKTYDTDKEDTKRSHSEIFSNRVKKIRGDFDRGKKETTEKIDSQIDLFSNECKEMDENLHSMLEDHKTKYQENANNLQKSLTNTVTDNNQNVKDAIADFTLQFMNHIDEADELALNNEEKLNDIFVASATITDPPEATTWHVVGMDAIIEYVNSAISRVKSSIIVVSHEVIPKILETFSQKAYQRKAARFFLTTHWDPQYEPILEKMKALGNIQFRQMKQRGEFIAMTRDAEEVLLAPANVSKEEDMIAIVSTQEGYAKLYSNFVGPVFMANSRPI